MDRAKFVTHIMNKRLKMAITDSRDESTDFLVILGSYLILHFYKL